MRLASIKPLLSEAERTPELRLRLFSLQTKIAILLNPDEADTVTLLKAMELFTIDLNQVNRPGYATEIVSVARRLLKAEWVRIKAELE